MQVRYQKELGDREPAVSIIVPIYNVEKYLEECVDSILGQTFRNIEIILVDDGSTDSSRQMADDYAAQDERIRVIHKENGGASSARNAGMKIARGEYIYFCDSDDYISLNAIEILYDTAIRNDLDMVLFNGVVFLDKRDVDNETLARRVSGGNSYWGRKGDYGGECKLGKKMFTEMHINNEHRASVCLQLIRRAYTLENNLDFYEGILYEDTIYTIKALLLADKVVFIPQKLFHRRIRMGSIMSCWWGDKSVYSYFVAFCETQKFLYQSKWEASVVSEVVKEANEFKKRALQIWQGLNEYEKERVRARLSPIYCVLFEEILAENKNWKASKELWDIRHGYSFRIGRIVTWFPRKFRSGIKCLRRYGLIYTIKRTLEYLEIDMGTGDVGRWK